MQRPSLEKTPWIKKNAFCRRLYDDIYGNQNRKKQMREQTEDREARNQRKRFEIFTQIKAKEQTNHARKRIKKQTEVGPRDEQTGCDV